MEAPVITPIQNEKKEFRIQTNGENYIISLEKKENNNYVILEINYNSNDYFIKFNQKEISSIIKEFKFASDLNEIYDILSDVINNQKYKIHHNKDNLIFTIKICKMNGKEEYNLVLDPSPTNIE